MNGLVNPAQILLNKSVINVNPNQAGLEAFNVGTSNLMSSRALRQMFEVDETSGATKLRNISDIISGKSIKMFDVETSGIFNGSQIVQMATTDIASAGKISLSSNVSFQSKQLGGLMYGNGSPFSSLLESPGAKIASSANGGVEFLDESAKMLNNIMDSNSVIAGHNLNFDIQKLLGTMKQMGGYSSHKEAQEAVKRFYSRIESGETILVDTLEYNRAYMNDLVNKAVDEEFASGRAIKSDSEVARLHREFMYSPEIMADTKIGGGAAYASVEAISLNTDLTARIVRDAEAGDEAATVLLDKMQRGSHLADTDTLLQAFIYRYTSTDKPDRLELARPGGGRSSSVYEALSEDAKKIADSMKRKIYSSSAMVPTKNIADVQHLSDTVFDYILNGEGIKNVTLFDEDPSAVGFIRYDTTQAKFMKHTPMGSEEYTGTADSIRDIIRAAKSGDAGAASRIANFGINYGQQSRAIEMGRIASESIIPSAIEDVTSENILKSIGKVYSNFGTETTLYDALRISSSGKSVSPRFGLGFAGSTVDEYMGRVLDVAKARASAGSAYSFLDQKSTIFSTIMAEASHTNAEAARQNIIRKMGADGLTEAQKTEFQRQLSTLQYASDMDIFAEEGVSHFKVQKDFVGILNVPTSELGETTVEVGSRIILPGEVLKDVIQKQEAAGILGAKSLESGRVSLSVAKRSGEDIVNAFWKMKPDAVGTDYLPIANQLIDDALEAARIGELDTLVEAEMSKNIALVKMGTEFRQAMDMGKISKDELAKILSDSMAEGGIGYASLSGEQAERTIRNLNAFGVQLSNDQLTTETAAYLDMVDDTARLGAWSDQQALEASGLVAQMQEADSKVLNTLNTKAKILSEAGTTREARKALIRGQLGGDASEALVFFMQNKKTIYGSGLGLLAAGAGYYMYNKVKENQIYNETLEEQPTQGYSTGRMMQETMQPQQSSFRRDPLTTAGVVGNLDRNKIGHYKMGAQKNAHLFGG